MSMTLAAAIALAGAAPLAPPPQAPARYTVKAGDTLIGIGQQWFVDPGSWPQVRKLNRVTDPRRMPVGMVLNIPRALLKSEPVGAKVVAWRGDVSIDGRRPAMGSAVREGMAIATGADASVTVECDDGSRFSLPSRTRLGIARLRRVLLTGDLDRVFTTAQGRGEWTVSPAPTPGSRFMVTTPVSVSAVRGTGFRVSYEDKAVVGVTEGTVGVSGADVDNSTAVPKGKGVAVSASGVGAPVDLLASPDLLRPGATQSGTTLSFAVRAVPGAKSYTYEIGTDAGLVDRVAELRDAADEAQLPEVADGSYFVRVAATDAQGIDGFARIYAFERLRFGVSPPETIGRGTRFRWTGGDGHRDYRFTLYADEATTRAIIDRAGVADTTMTVTDLKPGTYWWRVSVTKFGGGRTVTATGPLQSFTIARR